jgi:hypothetical protein
MGNVQVRRTDCFVPITEKGREHGKPNHLSSLWENNI